MEVVVEEAEAVVVYQMQPFGDYLGIEGPVEAVGLEAVVEVGLEY